MFEKILGAAVVIMALGFGAHLILNYVETKECQAWAAEAELTSYHDEQYWIEPWQAAQCKAHNIKVMGTVRLTK